MSEAQSERIGKYHVVRKIGTGATSAVFLAVDPFTKREVAIKLIYPEALKDRARGRLYKKLFLTEASLAGKLKHPHIVEILDAVVEDDQSYLVMEYVPGSTLEKFCEIDNLLPLPNIVEIVYKCCMALEYAQRNAVIHRDIKPANILLSSGTDIKISDFGAAITAETQHTTQISAVGSPAYMSPQQIKEHPLTHQTDIYSLGVVMFKALTGKLPYTASTNVSMIYHILNTEPPKPSSLRPEVPPSIDAIVMKAMAKDLEARYQTWEEFARDLVAAYEDVQGSTRVISDTEKFNSLRALDFFRQFTDVELWEVVRITRWNRFPQGKVLIREGDFGSSFFILTTGEVSVTYEGKLLNALKAGECFGEMAYLAKRAFPRSASVTALTDITVIEISADMLKNASENCRHKFNGAFLSILVDRLAMANLRLSALLAEKKVTIF